MFSVWIVTLFGNLGADCDTARLVARDVPDKCILCNRGHKLTPNVQDPHGHDESASCLERELPGSRTSLIGDSLCELVAPATSRSMHKKYEWRVSENHFLSC